MSTKEQIWREALRLFAFNGYDGVSVKEIASAVGIKDSSIYNHYKSKQEIYDSILDECSVWIMKKRREISINDIPGNAESLTEKDILEMNIKFFEFFLTDETAIMFQKMLMREQYTNPAAKEVFYNIFVLGPIQKEIQIFSELMEKGYFKKTDAQVMALQFYAPIFLLMANSGGKDDAYTEKMKKQLEEHIMVFGKFRRAESVRTKG